MKTLNASALPANLDTKDPACTWKTFVVNVIALVTWTVLQECLSVTEISRCCDTISNFENSDISPQRHFLGTIPKNIETYRKLII